MIQGIIRRLSSGDFIDNEKDYLLPPSGNDNHRRLGDDNHHHFGKVLVIMIKMMARQGNFQVFTSLPSASAFSIIYLSISQHYIGYIHINTLAKRPLCL